MEKIVLFAMRKILVMDITHAMQPQAKECAWMDGGELTVSIQMLHFQIRIAPALVLPVDVEMVEPVSIILVAVLMATKENYVRVN